MHDKSQSLLVLITILVLIILILKNKGIIYEEADKSYVEYMLDNLDTGDYDELIDYIENRFNKNLKYEITSLYEDGYPLPSWSDAQ